MRRENSCAAGSVAEVPVVLFDRIGGVVGYAARGVEEDGLTNVGVGWVEGVVGDRLEEDKLAGGVCQSYSVLDCECHLPFCRDATIEMACHRAGGLDRGRAVAEVPGVRDDWCGAGAPVTIEGDQISRGNTSHTGLVGERG